MSTPSADSLLQTAIAEYAVANIGIGARNPDLSEAFAFLQKRVRELDAAKPPSVAVCEMCNGRGRIAVICDGVTHGETNCPACRRTVVPSVAGTSAEDAVRALVAKWRETATGKGSIYGSGLEDCADELEAALTAAQSRAQGGVDSGGVG